MASGAKANIAASTTDGSVISAVTGKQIAAKGFIVMAGGTATDVTFNTKPSGAGTAISCLFACGANGGVAGPMCQPSGGFWFITNRSEGLTVTTGTGSTVGVIVTYELI